MGDYQEEDEKGKGKLDEDTLSYFKRVESVIKDDDFDDEEAKAIFIENVFTQIDGNELALCCNQSMSRVFERLLEFFNSTQLLLLSRQNYQKKKIGICLHSFLHRKNGGKRSRKKIQKRSRYICMD